MINQDKYLLLLKKHREHRFSDTETNVELVTELDTIIEYEKKSGLTVGVLDNQPYYDFRMDVFKNQKNGQCFRYCNVSYSKHGSAVLVVLRSDKECFFLLNQQYRAILNEIVYEIPRGFADSDDKSSINTAIRELAEETGINVRNNSFKISKLGTVHPDSGLSNNTVSLYMVEIPIDEYPNLKVMDENETIIGHTIITESKFYEMIKKNHITDAFTLAAFTKYKCRTERSK